MLRASSGWSLILVLLAACTSTPSGGLDTAYTAATETTTDSGEIEDTEESGTEETETGEDTDTGEPDGEPLWFVAAGSHESVLLAVDLRDPDDVPPPEYLATGTDIAALFRPTPFASEAVTHDGEIEQLRASPDGELSLAPLASQQGNWLTNLWFGDDGANALATTSVDAVTGPDTLLWIRFDASGNLTGSFDITPPKQPGGSVLILARSPDSRWAAAAVNIQPNGIWDLYLLPIDTDPGVTVHIDKLDLTGIPAISVASFLSLHLDNQRVVYRREQLIEIFRPVAVGLDNPELAPADIGPNLQHTYSITPARDDASRVLVTNGGSNGYHQLRLIELDGPIAAQAPIVVTEDNTLALANAQPALGAATQGHGFDALGRIFYVYRDTTMPQLGSVGISLVTVSAGEITQRLELAELPPGAEIDDVVFDADLQLLGYRVESGNQSWINYVDLSGDRPASIRVNQNFDHSDGDPDDHARYGWSADGSRIAVVGIQQGHATLHVAELGDSSGTTVEIGLPDVESTPGFTLDHQPHVSPSGDQLMLWYRTQADLVGLIHASTDGSASGQVVLAPQHALTNGTYLPHAPK